MRKATVFEIKRFAIHDGDGIRTTVFFKGCPLKCVWCHNPEGLSKESELGYYAHKCKSCGACIEVCSENCHRFDNGTHIFEREKCIACGKCESVCSGGALKLYGKSMTVDELVNILTEDKMFYDESGGGVTFSGGECLMQSEFCAELLERLKNEGIRTAVDTSGFVSKSAIDSVLPFTDIFLYDIKAYDSATHKRATGCPNGIILENLKYINDKGGKAEIRIPLVLEYNADEIESIAKFLSTLGCITKVRVLPYHNYAASKYAALALESTLPEHLPTDDEIENAKQTLRAHGLDVVS